MHEQKRRLAEVVLNGGLAEATARLSCGRMVPCLPWSPAERAAPQGRDLVVGPAVVAHPMVRPVRARQRRPSVPMAVNESPTLICFSAACRAGSVTSKVCTIPPDGFTSEIV